MLAWSSTIVDEQRKFSVFGPAKTLTFSMMSYAQSCQFSSQFFVYITARMFIYIFTLIQTHMYIFISQQIWKINNVPGRRDHKKYLSINSVLKVWTPFHRQPPICITPLYIYFFPNRLLLATFTWKYRLNEIQDKHTKILTRERYFFMFRRLQNKITCFCLNETFTNNVGWHLLRNNNSLKYQKEIKEK